MNESEALQLFEPYDVLLFDYGGIWIDIHYDRTVKAFAELNDRIDFNHFYTQKTQSPLFEQFETGKISEMTFIDELSKAVSLQASHRHQIRSAWNRMLGELNAIRMMFLKNHLKHKRLFLLSNINIIHEKEIENYFKINPEYSKFYSYFEKVYFSHQIGFRKPDPAFFRQVIEEQKLIPSKTLFMDDSIQHIETANQLGLQTYWLNPSNSFLI